MIAFAFRLEGRVQGVSCRDGVVALAHRLGLRGFVLNVSDGAVEGRIAGPDDALGAFLVGLRHPSLRARVDHIALRPLHTTEAPHPFVRRPSIEAGTGDWPTGA